MLCKTQFQIIHDCSDGSLLSAQRCFGFRLLPILFKSQYWKSSRVSDDYTCKCDADFFLWFSLMSPINNVLLCWSRASFSVSSFNHEIVEIFYRMCSAKLSFKSFTIVLMEVSYRHSNALVFAGLYIVQVSLERLFDNLRRLHLQMWCWLFSLWFSMMCPINNVLLCFARASYFVQVSVMKMFKSSIEYALQNSVSIHSLLFWWNSPISAALLCFSLASYIFQVSMLKLFQSFGRLNLQIWCWIFLCGSHWCLL